MTLAAVLSKVADKQQQRAAGREAAWKAAVSTIADGREPDADKLEQLLIETGRTPESLRSAVERLQSRRAARAALDRGAVAEAELPKISAQIDALAQKHQADLADLNRKLRMSAAPLEARHAELTQHVREATAARAVLQQTFEIEPADRAMLDGLHSQVREAHRLAKLHETTARDAADLARGARNSVANDHLNSNAIGPAEAQRRLADAEHKEETSRQAKKLADSAAAEVERLTAEIEKLQALALEP